MEGSCHHMEEQNHQRLNLCFPTWDWMDEYILTISILKSRIWISMHIYTLFKIESTHFSNKNLNKEIWWLLTFDI
jgi:hypothetical protein